MPENNDHKKFAILMGLLATTFCENGISPARIEIYHEHLRDIDIDNLGRAVQIIIKTRKYPSLPTPAEIREAALGRDEDIETAALLAWGKVARAVSRGIYLEGDPIVDEAVRIAFGGWRQFGQTDPEQEMADRAHFLRVFKGLARSRRDRGYPALTEGKETKKLTRAEEG